MDGRVLEKKKEVLKKQKISLAATLNMILIANFITIMEI